MPLNTFPAIVPGYPSKKKIDHNIKSNNFGDGYIQRYANGLNNRKDVWTVVFDNIRNVDTPPSAPIGADTLEAFVVAQGCVTPFKWTPPNETVEKQWIIINNTYNRDPIGPNVSTVSFTIEEDFTIA